MSIYGRPSRERDCEDDPYMEAAAWVLTRLAIGLLLAGLLGPLVVALIVEALGGFHGGGGGRNDGRAAKGEVVITTDVPVIKGVDAWVELDGKRVVDWPAGNREVSFTAPAGEHVLTVNSIYKGVQRLVFHQTVTVPAGQTLRVDLGR